MPKTIEEKIQKLKTKHDKLMQKYEEVDNQKRSRRINDRAYEIDQEIKKLKGELKDSKRSDLTMLAYQIKKIKNPQKKY
jgi:phage-related minor tail protein